MWAGPREPGLKREGHVDRPLELIGEMSSDDYRDELIDAGVERAVETEMLSNVGHGA